MSDISKSVLSAYSYLCNKKLEYENQDILNVFRTLRKKYADILDCCYNGMHEMEQYLSPFWAQEFEIIKREFSSDLPFDFLRNRILMKTISCTRSPLSPESRCYLKYIKNNARPEIIKYLREDGVGHPFIISLGACSSFIRIQHIYHLVKYEMESKINFRKINSIIEWGGGYGDFASIVSRINPNVTYTVIDHPVVTALQYIYLGSILGENKLNLVNNEKNPVKEGFINLVSLNNFIANLKGKMFISTFALTESNEYALNEVMDANFFNCENFLIAYQGRNDQSPLGERYAEMILKNYDLRQIPISTQRFFDYYLIR
jgi:hypothetical protein